MQQMFISSTSDIHTDMCCDGLIKLLNFVHQTTDIQPRYIYPTIIIGQAELSSVMMTGFVQLHVVTIAAKSVHVSVQLFQRQHTCTHEETCSTNSSNDIIM